MFENSTTARRAFAGAAMLALLATGCGGTEPAEQAAVTATTVAPAETETSEADTAVTTDTLAAVPRQVPETLAFAINAAENESYNFTQGLGINFGPAGTPFPQTSPYAFGEVAAGQTHVRVDLEDFVTQSMASLASFGLGPEVPVGEEFDVWIDDSTVTLDLQNLSSVSSDVAAVSTGPVSVDLTAIDNADLGAVVQQFGQGSIATDPAALFQALSSFETMVEKGVATVGTVAVTEYTATVSVGDYYEAQGTSVSSQLGVVEGIALADESADAISDLVPQLEQLDLPVDIALDEDGRVRRVRSDMNVTDLVVTMFSNSPELAGEDGEPAVDLGSLFGPDGLQIVLTSWHEFHDYGTEVAVAPPEAVDVTADVDALFG